MTSKGSIYPECNPQVLKLFERAGHPAKVLFVALDYAKAQHSALVCNGRGDLVKPAFAVDNTAAGAGQLVRQVRQCAKERRIEAAQVFFGGEDCPAFAENFLDPFRPSTPRSAASYCSVAR